MRTAALRTAPSGRVQRDLPNLVSDTGPTHDRLQNGEIAGVLARLAALEAQVAALTARVTGNDTPKVRNSYLSCLDRLTLACAERGIQVSGDGHVSERDAAALIGRAASTLRGWRRYFDKPLTCRKIGNRHEYSLQDLARFLGQE